LCWPGSTNPELLKAGAAAKTPSRTSASTRLENTAASRAGHVVVLGLAPYAPHGAAGRSALPVCNLAPIEVMAAVIAPRHKPKVGGVVVEHVVVGMVHEVPCWYRAVVVLPHSAV
jgi:hypothetical protein